MITVRPTPPSSPRPPQLGSATRAVLGISPIVRVAPTAFNGKIPLAQLMRGGHIRRLSNTRQNLGQVA